MSVRGVEGRVWETEKDGFEGQSGTLKLRVWK
jgi:hypothetical protein